MSFSQWWLVSLTVVVTPVIPLNVDISNIPAQKGAVFCIIYGIKTAKLFPAHPEAALAHTQAITFQQQKRCVFHDIVDGAYAIVVFFDSNGNGKLDRNFWGYPREPWGLSNNPKIRFGPPVFADAQIQVSNTQRQVSVALRPAH